MKPTAKRRLTPKAVIQVRAERNILLMAALATAAWFSSHSEQWIADNQDGAVRATDIMNMLETVINDVRMGKLK